MKGNSPAIDRGEQRRQRLQSREGRQVTVIYYLSPLTGLERNIEKQPRDKSRGYLRNVPDETFGVDFLTLRTALR